MWLRLGVLAAAGAVTLVVLVAAPWTSPVLLAFAPQHGIERTDVPVLAAAGVLCFFVLRRDAPPARAERDARRGHLALASLAALLALNGALRISELDLEDRPARVVVPALLAMAAAWYAIEVWRGFRLHVPGMTAHRWLWCGAVLVVVSVLDTLFVPTGTVFGVVATALVFAVWVRATAVRVVSILYAMVLTVLNIASLSDLAGVDVAFSSDQGGAARSLALGGLLGIVVATSWFELA